MERFEICKHCDREFYRFTQTKKPFGRPYTPKTECPRCLKPIELPPIDKRDTYHNVIAQEQHKRLLLDRKKNREVVLIHFGTIPCCGAISNILTTKRADVTCPNCNEKLNRTKPNQNIDFLKSLLELNDIVTIKSNILFRLDCEQTNSD